MTTTDILENALAFAASPTYEGDKRMILHQAVCACSTLAKRIAELEAIVARFPVDADGDPVIPPAVMWALIRPAIGEAWVRLFPVACVEHGPDGWIARKHSNNGRTQPKCELLFKTKEAAEAAKEA